MRGSLLRLIVVCGACGPEKSGGDAATDAESTTSTSEEVTTTEAMGMCPGAPTEGCPGFPEFGDAENVCGSVTPCAGIELKCDEDIENSCDEGQLTIVDVAPLDCALKVLATGGTGRISWTMSAESGEIVKHTALDAVGDGTAVRHGYFAEDLQIQRDHVARLILPAQQFFAECLLQTEWQPRFACLRESLMGTTLEVCLEGNPCPYCGD